MAGFHVTGVDLHPQPRYAGDVFVRADALEVLADRPFLAGFHAIHASPPCQHASPLRALSPGKAYPALIEPTRALLEAWGGPWVMENVMSAALRPDVVLCGGMFGLRTYRHRKFETNLRRLTAPPHPRHVIRTATKRRRERWDAGWHVSITGDVGVYVGPEAMGIDWMTGQELCEAIPPAYTRHLGGQLRAALAAPAGARSSSRQPSLFEEGAA
jgi:DNA (cytosine-5)-methyltransferase 1